MTLLRYFRLVAIIVQTIDRTAIQVLPRMVILHAKIDDLRPYDLRHTFATRLLDRGVHQFVISALLGHAMPVTGFGQASRITPGYTHVTWEAMVEAVETLEYPVTLLQSAFAVIRQQLQGNERKVG